MLEKEKIIDISNLVEGYDGKPIIRLHLAPYFRVHKDKTETEKVFRLHGLEPVYDPVRITSEIEEEFWEDHSADPNGFFMFPPKRLILGHTLESIRVPANIALVMRKFFRSEETGKALPLTTNLGAPLIHPGSTGPQTYEIINMGSQPLIVRIPELVCVFDVDYLNEPSVLAQQKMSNGAFGNQKRGKIELGNPRGDWEINAIRKALGLS